MSIIAILTIGHDVSERPGRPARTFNNLDVHSVIVRELAAVGIDGFTLTRGIGYWKGEQEECTVVTLACGGIEVGEDEDALARIREAAGKIRDELEQDCVMLTVHAAQVAFV